MSAVRRPSARGVLVHVVTALILVCIGVDFTVAVANGTGLAEVPFLLLLLITLAMGWLLAWRRRPLGWLIIAIPALFMAIVPATILAGALRPVLPGASVWLDWYVGVGDGSSSWAWLPPVWILLCQVPLRFPDGRLPSPRWRWFSWTALVLMALTAFVIGSANRDLRPGEANPAYVPWLAGPDADHSTRGLLSHGISPVLQATAFSLLALSFVLSIGSLIVRYRRGSVVERAQLRWMLWGLSLAVAGLIANWFLPNGLDLVQTFGLLLYALIPVSIAIAVLRYRLYEIDRIISRTAAWVIVTVAVVGPYVVVVLLVSLLPLSAVGVAAATLIAAAVFLPLLRVVRRGVDRLFNRAQYDAEKVVEGFGERVRTGADPLAAGRELVGAVERTLQPASLGLWTSAEAAPR